MTGTWIPDTIQQRKDLTPLQKIFYARIISLDNDKGCFASNNWFAETLGCSRQMASKVINQLKEKGLISVEIRQTAKQVKERKIKAKGVATTVARGRNHSIIGVATTVARGSNHSSHIEYNRENNKEKTNSNEFPDFALVFQALQNAFKQHAGQRTNMYWSKLSPKEKLAISKHFPEYIRRTAPKGTNSTLQYRRTLTNYLSQREWENPLPSDPNQIPSQITTTTLPKISKKYPG